MAIWKPVKIKNKVPGIERKKPKPADVPTALWIGTPYKDIMLTLKVPPPIPNMDENAPTKRGMLRLNNPEGNSLLSLKSSFDKNKFIQTNNAIVAKKNVR